MSKIVIVTFYRFTLPFFIHLPFILNPSFTSFFSFLNLFCFRLILSIHSSFLSSQCIQLFRSAAGKEKETLDDIGTEQVTNKPNIRTRRCEIHRCLCDILDVL
jgi:hypothetical protein